MNTNLDPNVRAAAALRNACTRAKGHLTRHEFLAAQVALDRGLATAARWQNGTHPKLKKADR